MSRARSIALSMIALMIVGAPFVVDPEAQEPRTAPAGPAAGAPVERTLAVELVRAVAWPVTALVMAFAFRRSIAAFVAALGTRVTKLSVFKVELELVPATSAISTPLLDDIRTATTSAPISDSSRMMLDQVQMGAPADYATIALGTGDEWLTSRLFIAAAMLERMRTLQVMVFIESTTTTDQRFLSVAPVQVVRWALARRYPHLEAAWARAYLAIFPAGLPPGAPVLPQGAVWPPDPRTMMMQPPLVTSNTGAMDPWAARQIVARFVDSVQRPMTATPGTVRQEWVLLHGTVEERADWVTSELLREILPSETFSAWTDAFLDAPRAKRTRAVLRRITPFVALTQGDREFVRLVNRRAFLEDIVAPLADEPETAA
jgi:hypothetical protein